MENYINILKQIAPLPDINSCKSALIIGPHSDDVEIGCGGIIAKLVENGCKVTILVATNGAFGTSVMGADQKEMAEIRASEGKSAANFLGAVEFINFDFCDNGFYEELDMAKELVKVITRVKPELLIFPDPNLPTETHIDHILVPKAVLRGLCLASNTNACSMLGIDPKEAWGIKEENGVKCIGYYFTHRENTYINIDSVWEKKLQSMALHESQLGEDKISGARMQWDAVVGYLTLRCGHFGKIANCKFAEALFIYGPTHAHCFPEIEKFNNI